MEKMQRISAAYFEKKLSEAKEILDFEQSSYFLEKKDAQECEYSFSNTTFAKKRYAGCIMKNRKDMVVDGNDSLFVFRGHLTPFIIDSCQNITIKNLTIDFDPPLVAEAEVIACAEEYIDVLIDGKIFPHICRDNWLYFDIGEEEPCPLWTYAPIKFGKDLTVAHTFAKSFFIERVEEIDENTIRFFPAKKESIKEVGIGEIFVLRHNKRLHPGIFIENCTNVTLENITIHSCGGLGTLTQFSKDVTFRNVKFLPNKEVGRKISGGRDDGMQIVSCRGKILIEECSFLGLMDDPVNIHGCSMHVEEIFNNGRTIRARYMHEQAKNFLYYANPGDIINIINQKNMNVIESAMVESWEIESPEVILLHFTEGVCVCDGDYAIENISNTAEFVCRRNRFGSCRARGLLVSTPKKVVIEENLFESSGSAILVAGDANYWYESGECHDVTIAKNVFTNHCLSSMSEFSHGMISICPIILEPLEEHPFHKNIHIKNNVFDTSDTPVLYAFSTKNLSFTDNIIFANPARKNESDKTALLDLSYCNDVTIENNTLVGKYAGSRIEYEHCNNISGQID